MREGGAVSLAVVGVHHLNADKSNRRFEIELCAPGDPVDLVPEPKNPADANAIAVLSSRGTQLGYITAERAPWIGKAISSGREYSAIFQASAQFGAWIRLAFDGEQPQVPAQREPIDADADQDWSGDDWPGDGE